jgi:hypothetical protein
VISATFTIDRRPLELIRNHAPKVPTLMRTAFKRQTQNLRRRILVKLQTEPGSPRYPIRWKSQKQRRAFFATNGFGGGIPHVRTHGYVNAFEIEILDTNNGGLFQIVNPYPGAQFIGGQDQQPFHSDTNWILVDDVVIEFQPIAERELQEIFYTIVDPFSGVR